MLQYDFSIKLLCSFWEITALQYECSPVNLMHIFRTSFYENTSGGLFLKCVIDDKIITSGVYLFKVSRKTGVRCDFQTKFYPVIVLRLLILYRGFSPNLTFIFKRVFSVLSKQSNLFPQKKKKLAQTCLIMVVNFRYSPC